MCDNVPTGPPLGDAEDLFRALLAPEWIAADRPSSAAFDDDKFSVDRCLLSTAAQTAARFKDVQFLAQFNTGRARVHGFDARDELDPEQPDNPAHAHVYADIMGELSNLRRKKRAKKLALDCVLVQC